MANSDDDSTSTSSSSSSSSSTSSSSSSSSSSKNTRSPAANQETSASSSPTDDQPSSLAGGAIKAEDGYSDANNSEEDGTQLHATRQGPIPKRGGRIRGGQKKRPRSDQRDEDQNEDEDSDSDSAIIFDEVHTSTADLSTKKPSKRTRHAKDQQSADDVDIDVDTFRSNSPTTQYWSDQAKGPSGDGTIFEGMNQIAVADIVGWSHAIGGGNGSRLQLNGGRSDIPIPPWGLSLHQPPPFQPMHSDAAPMRSEVPPPSQLLGLLLKCAEEKMSKSAERVRNGPQNADREQKMKVMRHMNNMFDSSALIAAGVAVEEILTSALLPLAAAHVGRCRAMDHQARIISDRGRKRSTGDKKYQATTMSSNMRTTTKKSQGKSNRSLKKGGKESDDEEKESVDDVVALDRDAFDAWTLPPTEALLQLAKTRKDEKEFRSKSAGRSNASFLPSATPTSEAIQQAIASAGSDQTQIQMNTDAAYDRSAAKWCQHHSLDSEMVQERMDDLFGLFLPKEPPRVYDNSSNR